MADVVVRLQSPLNISFNHTIETGLTVEEWNEYSDKEKQQVIEEAIFDNVEAYPLADDGSEVEW